MWKQGLVAALTACASIAAGAQLFGNGPELTTLANFNSEKFQFQSVKAIYWSQIVNEGRSYVERTEKVWVPARLYMPKASGKKVPAMVIVHGIGGLYQVGGRKRAYWDYAELLAENGIAAVVIDIHGARGLGNATQTSQTDVSLYTFVADAFRAADMLRSHPAIDPDRVGIMGFSKGGAATLLATDQRFAAVLSRTSTPFRVHIPIYPGCQVFPDSVRPTRSPVRMLLGELDNATGTSGCFEIEGKLKGAGVNVQTTVYPGAYHSWDEDFQPRRFEDKSSEDCRWVLRDGGGVFAGGKLLTTAAENQDYLRSCLKSGEFYVGRNGLASQDSRRAVVTIATEFLGMAAVAPAKATKSVEDLIFEMSPPERRSQPTPESSSSGAATQR